MTGELATIYTNNEQTEKSGTIPFTIALAMPQKQPTKKTPRNQTNKEVKYLYNENYKH